MSKIRSKNTKLETIVYRELRRRRVYFQKHYDRAVGKPDIALPRRKKAVFLDGDFWHGYDFAKQKEKLPSSFWINKIEENIRRDTKNRTILKNEGWEVLRVWGHEVEKNFDHTINKIITFLATD